jgi:hypothetical protein
MKLSKWYWKPILKLLWYKIIWPFARVPWVTSTNQSGEQKNARCNRWVYHSGAWFTVFLKSKEA